MLAALSFTSWRARLRPDARRTVLLLGFGGGGHVTYLARGDAAKPAIWHSPRRFIASRAARRLACSTHEPAPSRLHRLAADAGVAHHRAGARAADRRRPSAPAPRPTPSTSPSASPTCCAACSPRARSRRPSCRSWPHTRSRDGDEATRRLIDAVATVLFWALLVTCVVGVVARAGPGLADGLGAASASTPRC